MFGSTLNQAPEQGTPEQKLWTAVIARTVQEWLSGPLRRRRAAEIFLFEDEDDFKTVCWAAGLNPSALRLKLTRLRETGSAAATTVPALS